MGAPAAPSDRPRVLFVSHRFLFPPHTGGQIRTVKMLERLRTRLALALVIHVEHPHDDPYVPLLASLADEVHQVPFQSAKKYSTSFYVRMIPRLFSIHPLVVLSDRSRALEATVNGLAASGRFDLLVCDFLQPSLNFQRLHRRYRTLLFQHNVESMIARRRFQKDRNPLMRLIWGLEWIKMRRYEQQACRRFDAVVAVSEADKALFEHEFGATNVYAVPTGVDTGYFRPAPALPQEHRLVFVGSMDWTPNEDGILWFIERVLPLVQHVVPDATLTVVGREPSRRLRERLAMRPDVRVTGRVSDIRPYVHQSAVYVVPLRIGSGTRIKLYEAMAMGQAIVSTSIGAEGLAVSHGRDIFLADSPDAFADAVVSLLRDPCTRERLGRAARQVVERAFSWDRAAAEFADACRRVVDRTKWSQESIVR